ncbi:hypothetical protein [uncultured Dokdonia sp.]|uniref:hypothetical protein n=1 Tax=uncultured Dokdonia sp. TaxID=575653 RepID=UPI002634A393|nr:hypothetical protein [uncultured Dokdonia sp.]
MIKVELLQRNSLIFGIPLLLIIGVVLLTQSQVFTTQSSLLSIGVTADLLVTIPLVYFLLIRKTKIPKTTIVPFLILGMILCSTLIPQENQTYFLLFKKWIFPLVEITVITYIIYKVRSVVKQYNLKKNTTIDFFTALKNTCKEILPKTVAIALTTEIAVFYYGFIYWKKRTLKKNEFSYHKETGSLTLLAAIICIIAIETIVLHVVIAKSSTIAAWIVTFLSIYSGIQLFGFLKSILKRPISIQNEKIYLRYGIMSESIIAIKDIDTILLSSKDIDAKETRTLSFLGSLEPHTIIITLKKEYTLTGLYGIQKKYKKIAFSVDDKIRFKNTVEHFIN